MDQRVHNRLAEEQDEQLEEITSIAQHIKYQSQEMNR